MVSCFLFCYRQDLIFFLNVTAALLIRFQLIKPIKICVLIILLLIMLPAVLKNLLWFNFVILVKEWVKADDVQTYNFQITQTEMTRFYYFVRVCTDSFVTFSVAAWMTWTVRLTALSEVPPAKDTGVNWEVVCEAWRSGWDLTSH